MIKKEEEVVAEAPPAPAAPSPAAPPVRPPSSPPTDEDLFNMDGLEGLTMADLLGPAPDRRGGSAGASSRGAAPAAAEAAPAAASRQARTVDDFDFDEEAFLAALDENAPVGTTGEVVKGVVIGMESDGVYVDIGGKAPGFMPKSECGLGVITNLKERFPKGLPIEVLVTREQNADGMVTISARALALRHSWEKVRQLEKEGKVVQVKVSGFNRGGVTCDLEGLRGFIPRSQLNEGENHEALVGQTLGVAFLEVNAETRKLVLSEKRGGPAPPLRHPGGGAAGGRPCGVDQALRLLRRSGRRQRPAAPLLHHRRRPARPAGGLPAGGGHQGPDHRHRPRPGPHRPQHRLARRSRRRTADRQGHRDG
jgi:small subunit ribosomal protein S1